MADLPPERMETVSSDWLVLYGSLMRGLPGGHGESDLLDRLGVGDGLRRVGSCRFAGELFDLGAYPALRRMPVEAGIVCGELHSILDPGILAVLDEFEGFDPRDPASSDYLRERIDMIEPAGISAWVYVCNRAARGAPRVEGGDWRAHLAKRRHSAHDPGSSLDPGTKRSVRRPGQRP